MNRKQKIQLLQAIESGSKDIHSLKSPVNYIFIERSEKPGIFARDGIEYNTDQYLKLVQEIEKRRDNSKVIRLRIVRNAEDLNNDND